MRKTIILALLAAVSMTSCTKTKKEATAANTTTEKLGDLKPDTYSSVYFLNDGRPAVQFSGNLYSWNATGKAWEKFAPLLPGSGGFMQLVQDNQGNYYGNGWKYVYIRNTAAATWDTLKVGAYRSSTGLPQLISNGAGDIVIRMQAADTFYYYKKAAAGTNWTLVTTRSRSQDELIYPYFLCNNGNLYFSYDSNPYPRGILCDIMMNSNTGAFGLLFDKSDPANFKVLEGYANSGSVNAGYIDAAGVVYVTYQTIQETWKAKLYRLTPTAVPAKFELLRDLNIPHPSEASNGWFTKISEPFTVDDKGNMKFLLYCSKYPDAHWAIATGNTSSSEIRYFDHPLGQRMIYPNLQGVAYISEFGGYVYKW